MLTTIFFIWLGSVVPQRYQQKVNECQQQYGNCRLVGENQEGILMQKYGWNTTGMHIIHRADLLRLLVLQQQGGIFLDLDIRVRDWNFFKALRCHDEPIFGQEQRTFKVEGKYLVSNWFVCSGKNSTKLQYLIDNIDRSVLPEVLTFAGPFYLEKMKVHRMVLYPNVLHCYDSTWWAYNVKDSDGCDDYLGLISIYEYFGWKAVKVMIAMLVLIGILLLGVIGLLWKNRQLKNRMGSKQIQRIEGRSQDEMEQRSIQSRPLDEIEETNINSSRR